MEKRKIFLASDHAGFDLKQKVLHYLLKQDGLETQDMGCDSDERCDYPDFAHKASEGVVSENGLGIFICGSGNGICMSANKRPGMRAALCWMPELAELARLHNNANGLCLPARFINEQVALDCVKVFLSTEFEGGRHENRVNKIEYEH